MKRLGVILFAACAAALASQARADKAPPAAPDDKGSAEVLKADNAFSQAIAKSDAAAFDKLTSDDYIFTSSLGHMRDKAKEMEAFKDGSLKFEDYSNEEQKAHLYGDVAVVTGKSKVKGSFKDKTFDDEIRYTRVWVNHSGAWICVAEQTARILNPDEISKPKDK